MSWFEWFCVNVLLIVVLTLLLVRYFANKASIWKRLGIPHATSHSFAWNFITGKEHAVLVAMRYYNQFRNERFYGIAATGTMASLVIKDPELIENIVIKDFSNFHDRNPAYMADFDYLSRHLVNVTGLEWKNLRNKLAPTFTTGKLKGMMDQFLNCSHFLSEYIETHALDKPVEITNIVQGFTMDVVASCAFGLDLQTLNDENSLFKKYGLQLFRPNFWVRLLFIIEPLRNVLIKLGKWKMNEMAEFFKKTVMDMVNYRKANNIVRNDYLRLLIELHEADMKLVAEGSVDPNEPGLVDQRALVCNSFIFLAAGFETTATTLSYLLYELSVNQDIQEKTYREISDTLKLQDSKITYEAIKKMKYLRQVIDETLRKYPPIGAIERIANSPYPIPGTEIILPQGTSITLPIYSLHHDPKYFPEPDKFNPERFSEDNQHKITKMSYLPFGGGPRICIASRFAILEISVAVCHILMKFKLLKCDKTNSDAIELDALSFSTSPKNGLWALFERR